MPEHTTGPGREEVIICIYGTIAVTLEGRQSLVASGEAIFIPANTRHAVKPHDGAAQYAYVATKQQELFTRKQKRTFDARFLPPLLRKV